ncbi:hypothetical protein IAT38_003961 [Cryptococcus sp. DSM 104549]
MELGMASSPASLHASTPPAHFPIQQHHQYAFYPNAPTPTPQHHPQHIQHQAYPSPLTTHLPNAHIHARGTPPAHTRPPLHGRPPSAAPPTAVYSSPVPPHMANHTHAHHPGPSPPDSAGSENLPSNHIHIVQTTPQALMVRSVSAMSGTSTSVPPPLSNGPSPADEEVIAEVGEQTAHPPGRVVVQQQQQPQPRAGPRPEERRPFSAQQQHPQGYGGHDVQAQVPFGYSYVPAPVPMGADLWQSMNDNGLGMRAVSHFVETLSEMDGESYDGWMGFVDHHFEEGARFHLALATDELQIFDIPVTSLPRLFLTLHDHRHKHHSFVLTNPKEIITPPSHLQGYEGEQAVECEDFEWNTGRASWRGSLAVSVSGRGKLLRLEICLDGDEGLEQGDGAGGQEGGVSFPEGALRVLRISQQMEDFALVMAVAQNEQLPPAEALRQLTQQGQDHDQQGGHQQ